MIGFFPIISLKKRDISPLLSLFLSKRFNFLFTFFNSLDDISHKPENIGSRHQNSISISSSFYLFFLT
ncbi:hypothetical protein SCRDD08_00809 [Streptococcus cristatus]|uniref:Uncharacterized protein n=1 Tax=Streptococcus cristatus TaxID=45634 RepID=A0A139N2J3_STRCR|nr:hypothetical protein SCRDD08_00809 [Streptococcus cristatus]